MRDLVPTHSPLLSKHIDLLACPACRGKLRLEGGRVVCVRCTRRYPIVDGLPVLIVERAEINEEVEQ